ncbi:HD domain-containing protein [Actinomyces mediterranea]|uniref:HD domain-containing protein n=1 Tax=Actinomyces mediterranea TaxID=1871028 RepID=UPI000970A467|nr:HD domain-containing protein [Actinomyces mediterranea]
MRLTADEIAQLDHLLEPYLDHDKVQLMRTFVQHGAVSTLDHCINVASVSFWLNRRLNWRACESDLAVSALLHDFYLYDWHGAGWSHSYLHPLRAAENARKYFDVSERMSQAIESHMWPWPPTRPPRSREGAIICMADKICALLETVLCRRESTPICR